MNCSTGRRWASIGLVVVIGLAGAGSAGAADPVEDLRQALPLDDVANPTEAMLTFRRNNLQKKIDALKSIGALRRALVLDDWRDNPGRSADLGIRRIDADMRRQVAQRLTARLEAEARGGPADNKVAVANLIAELGPNVRALAADDKKIENKSGLGRSFLPILQVLIQDKDARVRQHALRALGNINPEPMQAGPLFGMVLKSDPSPGPRRVAADGLSQMVRVVNHLHRISPITATVTASQAEVLDALHEAIHHGAVGFRDADSLVRQRSVEAFQAAVETLNELVPKPLPRKAVAGRPLTDKEQEDLAADTRETTRQLGGLRPVLAALRTHVAGLTALLKDTDSDTRQAAMETLRQLAMARQRIVQWVSTVPNVAEQLAGADPLEGFLQKDLPVIAAVFNDSSSSALLRKSATLFLMHLEERAAPAAQVLIAALGDPDRAVRWIAARTLAHVPPDKAAAGVPALAKMAGDVDVVLRIAAATTLEALGKHALPAGDALARAATFGDADGRKAAMRALVAIGPQAAPNVAPKLIEVLAQADADPQVLSEACHTLAQYGAAAQSAVPALRRLLGHDDSEVRLSASEAILAVNAAGKK
ncbi:MAG: HEAT repeat domain-containing protein [Gemmataceae bacterium]|nr:HEAT repeat domain-containing protein [Gemmataceae bacterium]